jgi:WD40 repeat protein/tRNA A-37 threonylcarbamoyl transferase component Bud32
MSYCLNPACPKPENPDDVHSCQSCSLPLLLKERYRAIEPIGQGGFGKTFLAVDEDMPSQRQCVIKQFFNQSGLKAQKAKELFVQEAVQLEKLGKQHPQIPELFAHVELGIGLFLVQEFIDGQNLLQELKQEGAFDEAKIRQLLNDLLPVLQFIHSQQVIHRDIKPDNIIRRQVDGKLILVDFGASKFATETALERTGTVIGSRGYAAPEQSEGKAYFSSDLFGLGATCFHLLTDTHPSKVFCQYGDWEKYLRINLNKSGIRDTLKRVLTKLLQPDISQRYQSTEEVLKDLNLEPNEAIAESPLVFHISALEPNTQTWRCVDTFTEHSGWVTSVAMSPDEQTLATGSRDETIKLWHLDTGKLIRTFTGHSGVVTAVTISRDGKALASGSIDDTIKLWHLGNGKLIQTLKGHLRWITAVVISPDGQTLASGSEDETIKLWHLGNGKLIHSLTKHSDKVTCVTISPDGQTLASGSQDKTIKLWHLSSGMLIRTLTGHSNTVTSVTISSDGQTLASGSSDGSIKLWHLDTGKLIHSLTGHSGMVTAVAISKGGQVLASGSIDHTIKLWHLGSSELIDSLNGHSDTVASVAISSDGKTLASGSFDKTIKIWRCD